MAKKKRNPTPAQRRRMEQEAEARDSKRRRLTLEAFELVMFRAIRESAHHHIELLDSTDHYTLDDEMLNLVQHTADSWKESIRSDLKDMIRHATYREGEILSTLHCEIEYFSACGFSMKGVFSQNAV